MTQQQILAVIGNKFSLAVADRMAWWGKKLIEAERAKG